MTLAQNPKTLDIDLLGEGSGISGGRPGEGNGGCVIIGLGLNDIVSSFSGSELDKITCNSSGMSEVAVAGRDDRLDKGMQ
jgi:hypothetical protein